jgi:hypothetical protein
MVSIFTAHNTLLMVQDKLKGLSFVELLTWPANIIRAFFVGEKAQTSTRQRARRASAMATAGANSSPVAPTRNSPAKKDARPERRPGGI